MRKLLNTLFVINEDAYLTLDGETLLLPAINRKPTAMPCIRWKASSALLTRVPAPL